MIVCRQQCQDDSVVGVEHSHDISLTDHCTEFHITMMSTLCVRTVSKWLSNVYLHFALLLRSFVFIPLGVKSRGLRQEAKNKYGGGC